jgi:hypothetical protein
MLVDELYFHRRRRLPRWERLGHPLDTLSVLACYAVVLALAPGGNVWPVYAGLAVISCVFVTKDEFIHAGLCSRGEHWLHAVLFVLHPVVFGAVALLWVRGWREVVAVQAALTLAFGVYQLLYWNVPWRRPRVPR